MVSRVVSLAMRAFEFLWTLLIMAIVGNMIASAFAGNPSLVNYDMFVAVFSMLSLFYLIPATVKPDFAHPVVMIALDVLNLLFFLCAGIAMAAELGVHSCDNDHYTHTNSITNGANDTAGRCREAQASTAFLWFGFAAYTASAIYSFMDGRSTGVNLRSSRRSGPAMSQV